MLAALQSTLSPPRLSQPAYVRLLEAAKPVPLDYGCGVSLAETEIQIGLERSLQGLLSQERYKVSRCGPEREIGT